jgi:hypothetical protein
MFNDACLSKLGYYGRSIVVEALDDICSFGEVRYCLFYIFFLCLEEKVLLVCYVLCNRFKTVCYNFEVFLLLADFKESLTCTITLPQFVL